MKFEKWHSSVIGAVLAFLISLGAAGSMITGFRLNIESMAAVVLSCAVSAAVSALCFRFRRGGTMLLCGLALWAGFLWHRGTPAEQLLALIYNISVRYDGAYGWGVLRLMDGDLSAFTADYPMAVLGCIVAIAVSLTVCRRKKVFLGCLGGLLPLFFCLVVTDTVPDTFYLFLLMFGLGVLLLTNGVRREDARQGNRLAVLAALPAALALGILFLAIPREGYVNQTEEIQEKMVSFVEQIPELVEDIPELVENIPEAAETMTQSIAQNFTGASPKEVSLDTLGARSTYRYPVMDVTAQRGGTLYLRGQDYDSYTGTGWTASQNRSEVFSGGGEASEEVTIRTRGKKDVLYLPYYPSEDTTLTGGLLRNDEGVKEYTILCKTLPDGWKQTLENMTFGSVGEDGQIEASIAILAGAESAQDTYRYRNLPNATKTRAKEIVASLLTSEQSATEKADTIAAYVRNSALYDLDTGRMPREEEDFALWFLEDSDTGYCVHFATAAVVLLRAADIEARYVTGYMVRAKAGQTVTVTGAEAHAWAEYYEPALGIWIPLEATPADLNGEEETQPSGTETTPQETEGETTETSTQPEETKAPEETMGDTTGPAETEAPQNAEPVEAPRWLGAVFRTVLLIVLAAAALEGQRKARLRLRRQKQRRGAANARALACWRELALLAKLRKETPPQDAEQLAQKAKYSQHTLTEEELAVFEERLQTCRRMLREESWVKKLICRYIFAVW